MKKLLIGSLLLFTYSCNSTPTSNPSTSPSASSTPVQKVAFSEVKKVFDQRCISCHATTRPSGNLSLEDTNQIKNKVQNINNRVVVQKTMPPVSSNTMTQSERDLIKNWIDSGASIE